MKFMWFELPFFAGIMYAGVVVTWLLIRHVTGKMRTVIMPVQFGKTAVLLGVLLVFAAGFALLAGGNDTADTLSGMGFYLLLLGGFIMYGSHVKSTVVERLAARKKNRYALGYREILELAGFDQALFALQAGGEAVEEVERRAIVRECIESLRRYDRTKEREHLEKAYRIIRFIKKWDKEDRGAAG
jgi:hypothetical protein